MAEEAEDRKRKEPERPEGPQETGRYDAGMVMALADMLLVLAVPGSAEFLENDVLEQGTLSMAVYGISGACMIFAFTALAVAFAEFGKFREENEASRKLWKAGVVLVTVSLFLLAVSLFL